MSTDNQGGSEPSLADGSPIPLPDVHQGVMNETVLRQYLQELGESGSGLVLSVKDTPRGEFRAVDTLASLSALLLAKSVWGAQLAYRLGEESWVDTLLVRGDETRLVRMQPTLPA